MIQESKLSKICFTSEHFGRSLLDTINYMECFILHLTTKVHLLNTFWVLQIPSFGEKSKKVFFKNWKKELSANPILALFDPAKEMIISSDAFSYDIIVVLKQKQDNVLSHPVANAYKSNLCSEELGSNWKRGIYHSLGNSKIVSTSNYNRS